MNYFHGFATVNTKEAKMNTPEEIKKIVKEKYAAIARNETDSIIGVTEETSCCGPAPKVLLEIPATSCCGTNPSAFVNFQDDYTGLEGYVPDADLGLGCGLPTEFAAIKKGDVVVDLGSGAGNDVFVARSFTGKEGRVIGIDMTEDMITRANINKEKLGYDNVEFLYGEIEEIPLENETADVVVSNCVMNLVPDKNKAFAEVNRILKQNGHFCISDIVTDGEISDELRASASLYAGCVSGALKKEEYLDIVRKAGFKDIEVKKEKRIIIPDSILEAHLTEEGLKDYNNKKPGIFSITVVAYKN